MGRRLYATRFVLQLLRVTYIVALNFGEQLLSRGSMRPHESGHNAAVVKENVRPADCPLHLLSAVRDHVSARTVSERQSFVRQHP